MYSIATKTDSYKQGHSWMYPPKTTHLYYYFEARGGPHTQTIANPLLQYILQTHFEGPVARGVNFEEDAALLKLHFGGLDLFNKDGWRHIINKHGGNLPLSVKAIPEGTLGPLKTPLFTVENTCEECFWVPGFCEDLFDHMWYPTTVATKGYYIKKLILKHLEETGSPETIDYRLHDFGFRGVSCYEQACIGGAAHLVNFTGTDNGGALDLLKDHYEDPCAGYSIIAMEHGTIISWGREHEVDAYRNVLQRWPNAKVSIVIDSYDPYNVVENIFCGSLKELILNRPGTLVVRPDTGYPPDVDLRICNILGDEKNFGFSVNSKGYKVLNPKVSVIQGDRVDYDMIDKILTNLKMNGWSADNMVFGSGGSLLQKMDRDTFSMAYKPSWIRADGVERDFCKEPLDDVLKHSKKGRFKVVLQQGAHGMYYETLPQSAPGDDILQEVFRDGEMKIIKNFNDVRAQTSFDIEYWK